VCVCVCVCVCLYVCADDSLLNERQQLQAKCTALEQSLGQNQHRVGTYAMYWALRNLMRSE